MIKQKNNGKDWDLALVIKFIENEKIKLRMFLIQISINKKIKQIQKILQYLNKKIDFIKAKLFEILNIEIDETNILFIFNHHTLAQLTSFFCQEFAIPFIFFNYSKQNFMTNDFKEINYQNIIEQTSYKKNAKIWESSLNYEPLEYEEGYEEEEENANEDDESIVEDNEDYFLKKEDILNDEDFSISYFE